MACNALWAAAAPRAEGEPDQHIGGNEAASSRPLSAAPAEVGRTSGPWASAEGSIIAAIMSDHMVQIASMLATLQFEESGIVSWAKGCSMSTAIQARTAQPMTLTARMPIVSMGWRATREPMPGGGLSAEARSCCCIDPFPSCVDGQKGRIAHAQTSA
ncbi:hypothetical protein ABLV49_23290 (plasmid) [Polaromonas hydrogenivorans]|uniref:Uncharacterized protein n=1 Tax=Polaromonas hydrogenivorans TaxID=335476 RepID=A0AAU7LYK9_9BURK